jgi:RNA polymerase sigma factor (sigma-70 family)
LPRAAEAALLGGVSESDARRAVEAVYRMEAPRLVAGLARLVRDVGMAEELAQDALLVALDQWPRTGVPNNPGAWLMTAAKRRGLDYFRRNKMAARKLDAFAYDLEVTAQDRPHPDEKLDDDVGDDLLSLIFTACHPALSRDARVALTLRLIGGLTTDEIARAFLVPEPTIAQRIVRAKRSLAEAGLPVEVPRGADRTTRLSSVLEVIYLIFNEGYSASAGNNWLRRELCEEALRLGRVLAGLAASEAEVQGLVALMELQASRLAARLEPDGAPILLLDQDRSRWNQLLIRRGLAALDRAETLAERPGSYLLQAEIAACHARAARAADTDWRRIATLYALLAALQPSPIIELNRAVAVAMAEGAAAGLPLVDRLADEPALRNYHLLPSVRGDFLERLGRFSEAEAEFRRAATMTRNAREQTLLLGRAEACAEKSLSEDPGRPHSSR